MRTTELKNKVRFIENVNQIITRDKVFPSVNNIKLDVFLTKDNIIKEYLVVDYKGVIVARDCSGNQNKSNFEELSSILNGYVNNDSVSYKRDKENSTPIILD